MKTKIYILLLTYILGTSVLFASNKIYKITIDGGIGPAVAEYIENSVTKSEDDAVKALIVELNTPGGLLEATRDIVTSILESEVPIIVYVAPSGARAGSAGVFITLASNIAVMAPGTNIGAAHPVGMGGQSDTNSVMTDKVTNDASAFIRTIAQKRKRNVEWAEMTVRESISATENEALDSGAINYICSNYDSLLTAINGDVVETSSGEVVLNTNNVEIEHLEEGWRIKILSLISDPNIAYIFLLLGIYGIFFELYSPGSIFPGVIGGISIIIAAYSLQMLPINYAGLGLILLAIILFLIEIKVTSYGLLSVGGAVSFLLGSIMLIDNETGLEFVEISMSLIITASILTTLFFVVIIILGLKAQTKKRVSGKDSLLGETGEAKTDISPDKKGKIKIHGELWTASSDDEIKVGEEVIVTELKQLKLKVKKKN